MRGTVERRANKIPRYEIIEQFSLVGRTVIEICFGFHHIRASLTVADEGIRTVDSGDDACDLFGVVSQRPYGARIGAYGFDAARLSETFENGFEFVPGRSVGDDSHGGDDGEIDLAFWDGGQKPNERIAAQIAFFIVIGVEDFDDIADHLRPRAGARIGEIAAKDCFQAAVEPKARFVVSVSDIVAHGSDAQGVGGARHKGAERGILARIGGASDEILRGRKRIAPKILRKFDVFFAQGIDDIGDRRRIFGDFARVGSAAAV